MHPHELEQSVDTMLSSAREGQLLAEGVAKDSSKATFTRVRARELGEVIDHEAEKLDDADAEGRVAADKDRAVDLCGEIGQELGDLQTAPTDAGIAAEVERKLGHLSTQVEQLGDSI
jgi:hypothetical protein